MSFKIPNEADAGFADQAEPDSVDFDILAQGYSDGVISGCAVTAQGTPDMTVAVAVGEVLIGSKTVTVAAGNVTITAADGSNDRFDLVVVDDTGVKSATAGTAAANPVFPAIPANSIVLAAVFVPTSDTDIDANQIIDKRTFIRPSGSFGSLMVAANGSSAKNKLKADYLCSGTNDEIEIQAAIDAMSPGGIVMLAAGTYSVSTISLPQGVSLWGEGVAAISPEGTMLEQRDGVNASCIVTSITPATAYWHWVQIYNLRVQKVAAASDTLGHGIEVGVRTGELFVIDHVLVSDMPESGIKFARGGTTLKVRDVSLMSNGAYGIDIERTGSDVWQLVTLDGVSGDNNENALIRINLAGVTSETFSLSNIKSESSTAGKQLYVIELNSVNARPVEVRNLSARGSNTGTAIFHITGSICDIYGMGVYSDNTTDLIDDDVDAVNIPMSASRHVFFYTNGVMRWELNPTPRTESYFDFKELSTPSSPPSNEIRMYLDNADGDLKALFADGTERTLSGDRALAMGQAGTIPAAVVNDTADFYVTVPTDMRLTRIKAVVKTKPTSDTTIQIRRSTDDGNSFSNAFGTVVITAAGSAKSFSSNPADLDVNEGDVLNYSITVGGGDGTNLLVEVIGVAR